MRITGGVFKGRKITPPPKGIPGLRPSMDMVREAVFSILQSQTDFEGLAVLDLYSGSGSYGFESVSRGASSVCFVEKRKNCIDVINATSQDLDISDLVLAVHGTVESFLGKNEKKFDIIFADPPYTTVSLSRLVSSIVDSCILAASGMLVYECDIKESELISRDMGEINQKGMSLHTIRNYSQTAIVILKNE